jgi:hypothetical protein
VGPCEALYLEHFGNILAGHEDIGHEAIVDILGVCTLRKESSVISSLVTQHVLLFANPAVPDLPGARVDDEATST